uniref:Uncharacterized protein n=1 Tax=uncultured marine virus TaxID=186617 RepID=A0A0F7L723_9VIRU|nr:hypothetical protein [uncultured marine virus]
MPPLLPNRPPKPVSYLLLSYPFQVRDTLQRLLSYEDNSILFGCLFFAEDPPLRLPFS